MIAAPAEGPTIMPSAWVTLVAHSTHSAVETWPHSSTTPRGASLSSAAGLPAPSREVEGEVKARARSATPYYHPDYCPVLPPPYLEKVGVEAMGGWEPGEGVNQRALTSRKLEWKPGIQPTMPCLPMGAPVCTRAWEGQG